MDTCLATLFYKDVLAALEVCQIQTITLPLQEKAQFLGIGRWLILSASRNFLFTESNRFSSTSMSKNHRPGCQVCIIVLQCGQELQAQICISARLVYLYRCGAYTIGHTTT